MEILAHFAASLPAQELAVLQDVTAYFKWEREHAGIEFIPRASDDVAIRTFLLDCQVQGAKRSDLNRIRSSLEYFYNWLKGNGLITETPFNKSALNKPFLNQKQLLLRHNAFQGSSAENEVARLSALNHLAEVTNRVPDVQSMLNESLDTLLGVTGLNTAWISLRSDSGFLNQAATQPPPAHGYFLAAAHNLPPSLEHNDRQFLTQPPECRCQRLLNSGALNRGVNIVECSRLRDASKTNLEDNNLKFHASVPIICNDQPMGIMNFAAKEWQLLSASDLQFLTAGTRQVAVALERAHLYDQIRIQHSHLEHELNMARKVQVSLMPEKLPGISGYGLAALWKPAYETSGDYYNIFKLSAGRWGFIVADVCDKGAPAALYMALSHGLIRERVEKEISPAVLLTKVNRALIEQGLKTNFVTSFYAILDPDRSSLKYALAGHPPPLLRTVAGQVNVLPGKGIALGIIPDAQYEEMELKLSPGDSLIAFSDGLTDASNPKRESFSLTNLKTAVAAAPHQATALVRHLEKTIVDWVKEAPTYDDITLLVIEKK
jgi:serine phosphatase RsbU (regulator of sigma subunit)